MKLFHMKHWLLTLVIVLVCLPAAHSADILEDFTGYSRMLRSLFNQSPTDADFISDTVAHDIIRLSVITLAPALQADKAVFWVTTTNAVGEYALDTSVIGILGVEFQSADTVWPIIYMPRNRWWTESANRSRLLSEGERRLDRIPYFFDYTDDTLLLFPDPIYTGDSIRITAYRKILSLAAADNLDAIEQEYRGPIVHYAAWMWARARQHPLVEQYRQGFNDAVQLTLGGKLKMQGQE